MDRGGTYLDKCEIYANFYLTSVSPVYQIFNALFIGFLDGKMRLSKSFIVTKELSIMNKNSESVLINFSYERHNSNTCSHRVAVYDLVIF